MSRRAEPGREPQSVVTSLTKYVGGPSDLIVGGCSGAGAILEPIRGMRTILGTMCDPHTGWLLTSGAESQALGADQCSGPDDLLSASCSTAAVIRRQVSAPS